MLAEVAAAADARALEIAEHELEPEQAELHMAWIEHLIEPVLARWRARESNVIQRSPCASVPSSKPVCLMGTSGLFEAAYGGGPAQQAPLTCWPNGNPRNRCV